MEYRCANDPFNYCSEKPEWGKPPKTLGPGSCSVGGSCRLDPRTCGKHQTLAQHLEEVTLPRDSVYRHTQQATKTKPKRKKRK